jgi:2-amino-4-hydroxy-6-hydroxymethyldihydropteridine diphosphokinase
MGDPTETIQLSVEAINGTLGVIRGKSRLFRTPAFPRGSGPDFINCALKLETDLSARALLACLHDIEARFGRRRQARWAPRTLDLDLIAYDDQILPDRATYLKWAELPLDAQMKRVPQELILPHPRLAERAFVLVPLADVAPDWVHPVTGRSVRQMLDALPHKDISDVISL